MAQRFQGARILLTTFSRTLALRLKRTAGHLVGEEDPAFQRIRVVHLHRLADEIWGRHGREDFVPPTDEQVRARIVRAPEDLALRDFDRPFLEAEWKNIVDPWQVRDWATYRSIPRVGRGVPLGARQRRQLWSLYERVWADLREAGTMTWSQLAHAAAEIVRAKPEERFDHVVADECQGFGPSELRLLRALVMTSC